MSIIVVICSCGPKSGKDELSPYAPPSMQAARDTLLIQAVIDVPAGTSAQGIMLGIPEDSQGSRKKVDFLPCPGNYGYIAGCARIDTASGFAEPLPVILLMPALARSSVVSMRPIAVLSLKSHGRKQPVVVGIPVEPSWRSVEARDFVDLVTEYDAVRSILQTWFLNYLGPETFELAGWHDERYAYRLIAEWKINE